MLELLLEEVDGIVVMESYFLTTSNFLTIVKAGIHSNLSDFYRVLNTVRHELQLTPAAPHVLDGSAELSTEDHLLAVFEENVRVGAFQTSQETLNVSFTHLLF